MPTQCVSFRFDLQVGAWTRHAQRCKARSDRTMLVDAVEVTSALAWRLLDSRAQEYIVVMR